MLKNEDILEEFKKSIIATTKSISKNNKVEVNFIKENSSVKDNLINQLCETVRWRETLDFLDKSKVLSITDSGPGKTIIGMARKFKEMEKLALIDS